MTAKTVLIAIPETHLRHALVNRLERAGITALGATNGLQAEKLCKSSHPDLIVADYQLPGLSGLELSWRIQATSQTPVILLTARGLNTSDITSLPPNLRRILNKPMPTGELLVHIRRLLCRRTTLAVTGA